MQTSGDTSPSGEPDEIGLVTPGPRGRSWWRSWSFGRIFAGMFAVGVGSIIVYYETRTPAVDAKLWYGLLCGTLTYAISGVLSPQPGITTSS